METTNRTLPAAAEVGVLEARGLNAATSRTVSALSYAILLGGILTFAAALYMIVINYSSLPAWDGWVQVESVANGISPVSPAWLWQQHNEHRWVILKLLMAADLEWFQCRQVFLYASVIVVQLLHWALLGWCMWTLAGWRGALWRAGTGLVGFCLFCPAQWQNFIWGFQVCLLLPQLLATLSFVGLLLYWMESRQHPGVEPPAKYLLVSILAAVAGAYTLSSGNLLWPLLVLAALYLRLQLRAVLALVIAGTTSTALYLRHYVQPPYHANPLESLRRPIALLEYVATYFFSSWIHRDTKTWEIVCLIALAILVIWQIPRLSRAHIARPFVLLMILTILICLTIALVTATGRVNFGIDQAARASRYQATALLFWCCLGLLWLGASFEMTRRSAFIVAQVCLLLIFIRAAATSRYPFAAAAEHTFAQELATSALITGVYDPITLSKTYWQMDTLLREVNYLKANRLSIFAEPISSEVGKPLSSVFPAAASGDCVGVLKGGMAVGEQTGPGLVLAGWAWDAAHRKPAAGIVVTTNGIITGLGAVGDWLPNARTLYKGISSSYIGFYAFVPQPAAGSVVSVYALTDGASPAACYLDGWRQAAANGPGMHRLERPTTEGPLP
jgi:hypothetical protein